VGFLQEKGQCLPQTSPSPVHQDTQHLLLGHKELCLICVNACIHPFTNSNGLKRWFIWNTPLFLAQYVQLIVGECQSFVIYREHHPEFDKGIRDSIIRWQCGTCYTNSIRPFCNTRIARTKQMYRKRECVRRYCDAVHLMLNPFFSKH